MPRPRTGRHRQEAIHDHSGANEGPAWHNVSKETTHNKKGGDCAVNDLFYQLNDCRESA